MAKSKSKLFMGNKLRLGLKPANAFQKGVIPKTAFKKGQNLLEKHPRWKGRIIRGSGRKAQKIYWAVKLPSHPMATSQGYVKEHRVVMEKNLNRYLTKDEVVHHIDGNSLNNDITNLRLFKNNSEHLQYEYNSNYPRP